jgi:hypothetical protein
VTQNDVETVIHNQTPTPDLENSQITMFKDESESEVQSILIKDDNGDDELEKTFMNLRPSFPINNVNKNSEDSPCESDNELTDSYIQKIKIYNKFKTNSRSNPGKSFGSKCLSHKMTPKTENLRFEEPDSHSDSSKDSNSYERLTSHKEIIIENLNSF